MTVWNEIENGEITTDTPVDEKTYLKLEARDEYVTAILDHTGGPVYVRLPAQAFPAEASLSGAGFAPTQFKRTYATGGPTVFAVGLHEIDTGLVPNLTSVFWCTLEGTIPANTTVKWHANTSKATDQWRIRVEVEGSAAATLTWHAMVLSN